MRLATPARSVGALLAALALAVLTVLSAGAPRAAAATGVSQIAEALRESPVYVDPAASAQLSPADAHALRKRIEDAGKPVFVAVLPADHPTRNLFTDLRTATGITGVYAIRLGDRFDARADSSVLPNAAVRNLVTSVQGDGDAATQLTDFTERAVANMGGSAPSSWGTSDGTGISTTALVTAGAVLVAAGAGGYALVSRNRRRRAQEQRAALERLRVVVDEDITAFGEELDRLEFHPAEPGADDAMRADYERALDAYDQAKSAMAAAARPEDVRAVTQALEDGRFSLARLAARREHRPLPERRPPCFFDPGTAPRSPTRCGARPAARPARSRCARRTPPGWPTASTRPCARWTATSAADPTGTPARPTARGRAATSAATAAACCRACWSARCWAA